MTTKARRRLKKRWTRDYRNELKAIRRQRDRHDRVRPPPGQYSHVMMPMHPRDVTFAYDDGGFDLASLPIRPLRVPAA